MPVIGLTGNIGCGKSTVAKYLAGLGAEIIDADRVAREIVAPGTPALAEIVESFGREILNEDGTLNRKKLGSLVFADSRALDRLNRITHPRIVEAIRRLEQNFRDRPDSHQKLLVVDAPLLIEVGLDQGVDEIWVVLVDPDKQVRRLAERDRLDPEEVRLRIASQMPQSEKLRYARRVIDNSFTLEETKKQVDRHLAALRRIFAGQT
ncbi:MAG: dephospho-CoA kinase [Desulfotomaculaceae bacterium]|nr:dephospho-CoA kinase [Desulfotomaculaceae bacterium]